MFNRPNNKSVPKNSAASGAEIKLPSGREKAAAQILALRDLYSRALAGEEVILSPPLSISALIGKNGTTQPCFPILKGNIYWQLGVGLSCPCSNPKIISVTKDAESRGIWLVLKATNKDGVVKESNVLITHRFGRNAIKTSADLEIAALKHFYEQAHDNKEIIANPPLSVAALLSKNCVTRTFFPLPSGGQIEQQCGIGLPRSATQPTIVSIQRDIQEGGVWVTFEARNNEDVTRSRLLLLDNKVGREAIRYQADIEVSALRTLYERVLREREVVLKDPLAIGNLVTKYGTSQVIFPLLSGGSQGERFGLGLGLEIYHPRVTKLSLVEPGFVAVTLQAETIVGAIRESIILVDQLGIKRSKAHND